MPLNIRKVYKMQKTMPLETCCRCGEDILHDEPYMQSASVDIDEFSRKVVSSPVKAYHLTGPCHDDATRRERSEREARRASVEAV